MRFFLIKRFTLYSLRQSWERGLSPIYSDAGALKVCTHGGDHEPATEWRSNGAQAQSARTAGARRCGRCTHARTHCTHTHTHLRMDELHAESATAVAYFAQQRHLFSQL